MHMEIDKIESLVHAGLSEAEARIYLIMLQKGEMTAGAIAKAVGFHRRTVYDVLERLLEKGLVSRTIQNNIQFFSAAEPQRLKDYFSEKIALVDELIPKLTATKFSEDVKDPVRFFKGKYGLKTIFEDQISEGKPIQVFSASPQAYELFKFYFKWWDQRRKEKKISVKAIFSTDMKAKLKKIPLSEIRFLPERYLGPTSINIYAGKVAQIMWDNDNPFAVVVHSKEMADNYRNFFELLWNRAKA